MARNDASSERACAFPQSLCHVPLLSDDLSASTSGRQVAIMKPFAKELSSMRSVISTFASHPRSCQFVLTRLCLPPSVTFSLHDKPTIYPHQKRTADLRALAKQGLCAYLGPRESVLVLGADLRYLASAAQTTSVRAKKRTSSSSTGTRSAGGLWTRT